MIVMKFGGTSIADVASVERVTEIVRSRLDLKPVVVNSAMGKTTRNLLEVAKLSSAGMVQEAMSKIEKIKEYHFELAGKLISNFDQKDIFKKLRDYFEKLRKQINNLSVCRELTPIRQDKMLSFGELISTAIIAAAFRERGINTELLDVRNFIITDDNFTHAKPIVEITYQKIVEYVNPVLETGNVPILQGYIGSTCKGESTTLGFEGSDLTAMLVGAALDASDIQIWKDVSGIMTADPSIFPGAHTVKTISFAEAAELTFFGAKVLHPSAVEPARRKSIPVHIHNSKQPEATSTEITKNGTDCINIIKSIAYKRSVYKMTILSNRMLQPYDFLKSVLDILEKEKVISYITTVAESSIGLAIGAIENTESLIENLKKYGQVHVQKEKATISLVGENLRRTPNFAFTVLQNLDNRYIDMISYGASPISFTFVVNECEVVEVITQLHKFYFQELDSNVFKQNYNTGKL